ncbi:hypothetical protein B2J88_45300 [Rhodococcus sp. SRB_17]|nr:hypothetical protein [Rhodococcus sp. SRB_17]
MSGAYAVGQLSSGSLIVWTIFWLIFSFGVEWLNRLNDLPADRINQPERTRMALYFGVRGLRKICAGVWILVIGMAVTLVEVTVDTGVGRLCLAIALAWNILLGIGYSFNRFFKRRPKLVQVVLGTIPINPWLVGMAAVGGGHLDVRGWVVVVSALIVLSTSSLAIAGAKDLTDVRGDRTIGYESRWLESVKSWRGTARILGVQIVATMIFATAVRPAFVGGLVLIVLALEAAVIRATRAARTQAEFAAVREAMHSVSVMNIIFIGVATTQSLDYLGVALVSLAGWALLSRWVHWHDHFSGNTANLFMRLSVGKSYLPGEIYSQKGI